MAINDDLSYNHNKPSTNTNAKPNPLPKVQTSQNPRGRDQSPHSPYNSHAYGASLINASKNQRGRRNPESPTPTSTPLSPTTSQASTASKSLTIKATDIPQWTWTNRETITYLTEVLISKVGKRRSEARILASKAIGDGFGPTLFLYTRETWAYWFGDEVALALDGLIYSMRDKEGAVPENVRIEHYERRRFSFDVGEREILGKGEDGVGIVVEEDRGR